MGSEFFAFVRLVIEAQAGGQSDQVKFLKGDRLCSRNSGEREQNIFFFVTIDPKIDVFRAGQIPICIGEELCARNSGERGSVCCPVSCFQGEITRNKTMCWSLGLGLGEITRGTKQCARPGEHVSVISETACV